MFYGLLGSKFSNKCENKFKCILKLRIGGIKNKKQIVVEIRREDVADLLAEGHQHKAFARIDALCTDINLLRCYEIIEQSCEFIQSQLPILQKQRECPDEVAEAMSTLIYAAARFPDLPELCDLRHMFIRRYGSNIELYVNSEFMKKVEKKQLSKEEKLQIMQEIAEEFSVRWNMKEFDHTSQSPLIPEPDHVAISIPSRTNTEEASPVLNVLKSEVQSVPKGDSNTVKMTRQVQVKKDVHEAPNYEVRHLTEPAKHFDSTKAAIPPCISARRNQDSAINDGILRGEILQRRTPKSVDEPDNKVGIEHLNHQAQFSSNKPVNLVPPYTKPNVPRSRYNNEEPKYNIEEKRRERDEKEDLRVLHNKGRATNMIPPYVKPTVQDRPKSMRTVRRSTEIATENDQFLDEEKVNGHKSALRNSYNEKQSKEAIEVRETRTRSEHIEGNARNYGNLSPKISREQSRHAGLDEQEIFMERLVAHYSNKGANRKSAKNNVNDFADGVAAHRHHARTSSLPIELKVDKLTAQVASAQKLEEMESQILRKF